MKLKAFIVTIPVTDFSKNDDPNEAAASLAYLFKAFMRLSGRTIGEDMPFDIEGIGVEPLYEEGPSPRKKS